MRIRLLTITHKTEKWIEQAYNEYAKRISAFCTIELVEIPAEKRTSRANIKGILEKEGKKMLAFMKPNHDVIALDVKGQQWSTAEFAKQVDKWLQHGKTIDLLIGSADGLSPLCLQRAQTKWSLSPLTFPHGLVRVIVAEQIYRAFSILKHHPYHR